MPRERRTYCVEIKLPQVADACNVKATSKVEACRIAEGIFKDWGYDTSHAKLTAFIVP